MTALETAFDIFIALAAYTIASCFLLFCLLAIGAAIARLRDNRRPPCEVVSMERWAGRELYPTVGRNVVAFPVRKDDAS